MDIIGASFKEHELFSIGVLHGLMSLFFDPSSSNSLNYIVCVLALGKLLNIMIKLNYNILKIRKRN